MLHLVVVLREVMVVCILKYVKLSLETYLFENRLLPTIYLI